MNTIEKQTIKKLMEYYPNSVYDRSPIKNRLSNVELAQLLKLDKNRLADILMNDKDSQKIINIYARQLLESYLGNIRIIFSQRKSREAYIKKQNAIKLERRQKEKMAANKIKDIGLALHLNDQQKSTLKTLLDL